MPGRDDGRFDAQGQRKLRPNAGSAADRCHASMALAYLEPPWDKMGTGPRVAALWASLRAFGSRLECVAVSLRANLSQDSQRLVAYAPSNSSNPLTPIGVAALPLIISSATWKRGLNGSCLNLPYLIFHQHQAPSTGHPSTRH